MALYIVRHGKAGKRSQWVGPDMTRPLDDLGRIQAKELSLRIAALTPTWLVSSPYLRCIQTLQDLSELTGLPVLVDERLAEDSDITAIIHMLEQSPDGAVICSHGDVIPALIRTLENRGMAITTTPIWSKASVWVIERNGVNFTSAAAWPPPLTS